MFCTQLDRVRKHLNARGVKPARVLFHRDNAKPHVSNQMRVKLTELGWELLVYPHYSFEIASSDYHLFRSLGNFMRGHRIAHQDDLRHDISNFFTNTTNRRHFTIEEFHCYGRDAERSLKPIANDLCFLFL